MPPGPDNKKRTNFVVKTFICMEDNWTVRNYLYPK